MSPLSTDLSFTWIPDHNSSGNPSPARWPAPAAAAAESAAGRSRTGDGQRLEQLGGLVGPGHMIFYTNMLLWYI